MLNPSQSRSAASFVPRFQFPNFNVARSDFKGHQMRAMRKVQSLIPQLSLALELRDLRAPLATRNGLLDVVLQQQSKYKVKKLVVYTKKDTMLNSVNSNAANEQAKLVLDRLKAWHDQLGTQFMVIDCTNKTDVSNLMKVIRWNRQELEKVRSRLPIGFRILVSGMPNVGKSTLVNSLRSLAGIGNGDKKSRKVAKTGGEAGITRSTSEIIRISKESDSSGIFLIDTPGIGIPGRIAQSSITRMMSLSLCGCVKSDLVDPIIQADYLLYMLNLQPSDKYERYPFEWTNPSNDVEKVLKRFAEKSGMKLTQKNYDGVIKMKAIEWVTKWRQHYSGETGIFFDPEILLSLEEFNYQDYVNKESRLLQGMVKEDKFQNKKHSINNLF